MLGPLTGLHTLIFMGFHGGLDEIGHHKLVYVSAWFPVVELFGKDEEVRPS